jgi:hypothetical protein
MLLTTKSAFPSTTQSQPYQKIRSNPQPFLLSTLLLAVILNAVAFFHQLISTPFPFFLVATFFLFFLQ